MPAKLGCRLFIRGDYEGLGKGNWLETQRLLFDGTRMYLLAPAALPEQLTAWSQGFADGDWQELNAGDDTENLPTGFRLFRFRNPPSAPAWLPNANQPVQKNLLLTSGLTINPTTYFRPFPPTVRVEGGTTDEQVEAVLDDGRQRIPLFQDPEAPSLFHFPDDFPDEGAFRLHRKDESLEGKALLRFTSQLSGELAENFPGWNQFGKRIEPGQLAAVSGLESQGTDFNFQHANRHFFFPGNDLGQRHPPHVAQSETTPGDDLLHFLSTKPEWSVEAFTEAFGRVSEIAGINFERMTRRKRYALLDWDALGYLEYEPERKRIYLNQTQLVPVRTVRGCRAMLVGRRSPELLLKISELMPNYSLLQLSIERGDEANDPLVPGSVFIQSDFSAGKAQLEALAGQLAIPFRASELPQFGLLDASATVSDYWQTVRSSTPCENAAYWPEFAHPFHKDSLKFNPGSFDSTSALIEYKLQTWQREVRHWLDGVPYPADRNWGRYAVAASFRKLVKVHSLEREEFLPVIIENGPNLAIPLFMPLPRFFARALTLMSGKLPRLAGFRTPEWPQVKFYRVYQGAATPMITNFLRNKLGQTSSLAVK
ncbi:MAG: hypothetical protein LH606_12885 [Cytophagaceae bacterium]|nr:hypothetical protein [Cytophagaceae bacterium]